MEAVVGDSKGTNEQHQHAHTQQNPAAHHGKADIMKSVRLSNPYVKAALVYLLVALVVFYPITLNMASAAPGTGE